MVVNPRQVDGAAVTRRFADISFESFRARARDASLTANEKIGYPEEFRAGMTPLLVAEIEAKLPAFAGSARAILDIGIGCGELGQEILRLSAARGHRLVGVDSAEMLDLLPDAPGFARVPGRFPDCLEAVRAEAPGGFDAIVTYGVLSCVFADGNVFGFVDTALSLLAPGGRMLVGDLPNFSRLRRFLSSAAGAEYHRAYMGTEAAPEVPPFASAAERMDDSVLFGLLMRARAAGYDAWIVPQAEGLPQANRREDLLFARP